MPTTVSNSEEGPEKAAQSVDVVSRGAAGLAESPIGTLVRITSGPFSGQFAYRPNPLPRTLQLNADLVCLLDEASRAVGTLVGVGETLANPQLLSSPLLRREAVLSSRIEGTQASISDLFAYEASEGRRPRGDVAEVYNYVSALSRGLDLLGKLPVSLRLMNGVHATLMEGAVRGHERNPGELRKEQVWIGSDGTGFGKARFVPPPADTVRDLIQDWEEFNNEKVAIPPLVKCAMAHYQLETIHPYGDGNGRVGRLMVILYLHAQKILPVPLLYLSPYFERDRYAYYDHLYQLSLTGEWEPWIEYFLIGVKEQAADTLERARRLRTIHEQFGQVARARGGTANDFKLIELLTVTPWVNTSVAVNVLGITRAGAQGVLHRLVQFGILRELMGTWPKAYIADAVVNALQDS